MLTTVEVDWLRSDVMEFVYRGEVRGPDILEAVRRYDTLTRDRIPRVQLVDTLAVRSVPPELRTALGPLLDGYRDRGGSHVVMVASSALNQMLGRSMSFGAGLKLEAFESRAEALRYIDELAHDPIP